MEACAQAVERLRNAGRAHYDGLGRAYAVLDQRDRPVAGGEFGGRHLRYLKGRTVLDQKEGRGVEGAVAPRTEKVAGGLGRVRWGMSVGVDSVGTLTCSKAADGRVKSQRAPQVSGLSDPARWVQVCALQSGPGSHLGWGLHWQRPQ